MPRRAEHFDQSFAKIGIRINFARKHEGRLIEIDATPKAKDETPHLEEVDDTTYLDVADKDFQVQPLDGGKYQVVLDPDFVGGLPPHRKNRLSRFFDPDTERYAVVAAWDGAIPYAKKWVISYLNGYKSQEAQPIRWS
jgi:hypothetical protein